MLSGKTDRIRSGREVFIAGVSNTTLPPTVSCFKEYIYIPQCRERLDNADTKTTRRDAPEGQLRPHRRNHHAGPMDDSKR